jgi:hypothetical protein
MSPSMPDSNDDTIKRLRDSTVGLNSFEDAEQESQEKNELQAPKQPAYSKLTKYHRILVSSENVALQSLYDATNGDSWSSSTGWKTASDLNGWFGVTATSSTVVTAVDLNSNSLAGGCFCLHLFAMMLFHSYCTGYPDRLTV